MLLFYTLATAPSAVAVGGRRCRCRCGGCCSALTLSFAVGVVAVRGVIVVAVVVVIVVVIAVVALLACVMARAAVVVCSLL